MVRITPVKGPLTGRIVLPGSKSITNRVLLLAALARGTSRVSGALKSDDTARMADALTDMGVGVVERDPTSFEVIGCGVLRAPGNNLNLGNAGTAMRFLVAAAVLADGTVVLDGDEHMKKRPIGPLVEALNRAGVTALDTGGAPPVTVQGQGRFDGGRLEIDASLSSQYVSALLMLAACGQSETEVVLTNVDIGARGYIDLTIAAMGKFGAMVEEVGNGVWRVAPTGYYATDIEVEPDASAATYAWAWAAITGGAVDVGLPPNDFTQPDAETDALFDMFPNMPSVIEGSQSQDAVPTLAVLAAYNESPVRFVGISNLRVKECDRISVLAEGLNRIRPGLAREDGDDLVVMGDPSLGGATVNATIDPHGDHRMAMSFAIAGLVTDGISIQDSECVAKTYPRYWDDLASLGVGLTFK